MTDSNDERLRKALEQEPFALPKGEQLKAEFAKRFEASRKKARVRATVWLLAGLVLLFYGAWLLGKADSTKLMLLGAVVMLIGYESTVLIKLWYWTVDNKISVLKEIKRVELLMVEPSSADETERPGPARAVSEGRATFWDRISMKGLERAQVVTLVLFTFVGGVAFLMPVFDKADPIYRAEYHATVGEDGEVRMVARISGLYYGVTPVDVLDVYTGEEMRDVVWRDGQGNVLPSDARQEKDGWHCRVRPAKTIFRGDEIDLRPTWTGSEKAKQENGVWTFTGGAAWRKGVWARHALTWYPMSLSRRGTRIVSTVTLPPGAALESATPRPQMQWTDAGRRVLSYEDPQKAPGTQAFRITYRLSEPEGRDQAH